MTVFTRNTGNGNKKWKCLVCGAQGSKWQTSWKANRAGRQHIYDYHKGRGQVSIIKKEQVCPCGED